MFGKLLDCDNSSGPKSLTGSMSKGQLSSVCTARPACQTSMLSNTEGQSPLSISGLDLVLREGQSGRGWERGIARLIPHSSIVKVSALGGQDNQQSREWRVPEEAGRPGWEY